MKQIIFIKLIFPAGIKYTGKSSYIEKFKEMINGLDQDKFGFIILPTRTSEADGIDIEVECFPKYVVVEDQLDIKELVEQQQKIADTIKSEFKEYIEN